MKNNPFPQAQMLDSQGVLHEWHGAVHNPKGNLFILDNLLKSIAIRLARQAKNRHRIQAPSGFCADLAQPTTAARCARATTRESGTGARINSTLKRVIDRIFSR